jgi:hypothetical protein
MKSIKRTLNTLAMGITAIFSLAAQADIVVPDHNTTYNGNVASVYSLPDSESFHFDNDYTIGVVATFHAYDVDWVRLIGKGDSSVRDFGLWYKASTKDLLFQTYLASNGELGHAMTKADLNLNASHSILGVKNGTLQSLYLNGQLIATNTYTNPNPYSATTSVTIGGAPAIHTNTLTGEVSSFMLLDNAINQSDVTRFDQFGASAFDVNASGFGGLSGLFLLAAWGRRRKTTPQ